MIVPIGEDKFKVYWKHVNPSEISEKYRGHTKCEIVNFNTYETLCEGQADCIKNDNFNKQKGKIVSLTKAIKHLPKDVRRLFWQKYKEEINFK